MMTEETKRAAEEAILSALGLGIAVLIRKEDGSFYCDDARMWRRVTGQEVQTPIPMRLTCPSCGAYHVDMGEFAIKVHHTHACQECGMVWRPAVVNTVGVRFLPGFRNEDED